MKPKNYITNKVLYEHMSKHREKVLEAKAGGNIPPPASDYIGKAILLICNNLSKKGNFGGYTLQWKQEMISDGIIDCVAAVNNFDPTKTTNPFAYFTQIAWNAYIRRIHKEKKQTYIKHKNFINVYTLVEDMYQDNFKPYESSDELIKNFENTLSKTKKPSKLSGLEKFTEGVNKEVVNE